ncbi:hypothetical protein CK203_073929 [Vitis vinifera]|uniref:Retrotransposon gag domain-containing protein n=1 Tax=Vitis vinifera TaxID=29760 RepID=A0A438DQ31_VITVI|nr:hypothetical protein CK203_073929 [Vitis vinifera]
MGYIDAREHSGGERHFDVDWSPIIEDLYSPELDGCVPPEGTIASARDLLKSTHIHLEPPFTLSTDTFSLGSTSWIRVGGAIASLGRRIDGQQAQQVPPPDGAQYDHTVPPPPPPSQSAPQAMPFTLHSQTGVAPPPITVPTPTSEDPHARMDRLEQGLRQLRTLDRATTWEGFDGVPVASLPAKFRMPDIERYTGIGCPRLHLRLYSTVMRAHGLDEPQMITLFPLSLSGAAQRWFASLEASRRRTWDDLAQEFLRQFSFNTVVDVSRRELEALRQRERSLFLLSFPAGAGR